MKATWMTSLSTAVVVLAIFGTTLALGADLPRKMPPHLPDGNCSCKYIECCGEEIER